MTMEPARLRDSDGDLWEVLPESGYVPRQDENWIRYQDEEMRGRALVLVAENTSQGSPPEAAQEQAWSQLYEESGHPRVYVREVPHEHSTGASPTAGPRGVYEVIAWLGAGGPGAQPGAMLRTLVRPSARWYREQLEAAERDFEAFETAASANAALGGEDDVGQRNTYETTIRFNRAALTIAEQSDRELSVTEMQRALEEQGIQW